MKFSIIVPIHNEEKYLADCLNSIAAQTVNDYEVILVLNACTDGSLDICMNWAERRTDTTILTTEIAGLSNARNMGMRIAKGDWLVFFDSDDCMRANALSVLAQNMDEGCDFIIANYSSQMKSCSYSKRKSMILPIDYQKALLDRAQHFRNLISGLTWNPIILDSVCAKAYNNHIIKRENIEFDKEASLGEDLLFNMLYSSKVDKICCIDEDVYYYRINNQSVSRTNDVIAVQRRMTFLTELENLETVNVLQQEKRFKMIDILLRSIIAGTSKISDIDKTYTIIMPYLLRENQK